MLKVIQAGCEPERGTKRSACIDLFAAHSAVIEAGQTVKIGLGVMIDMDKIKEHFTYDVATKFKDGDLVQFTVDGALNATELEKFLDTHYLQLQIRSSLGADGLIIPNGVGIIDLDYDKEIQMTIHNPIKGVEIMEHLMNPHTRTLVIHNLKKQKIEKGDKIGQIMLCEHKTHMFGITTDKERTGGFGSTGK